MRALVFMFLAAFALSSPAQAGAIYSWVPAAGADTGIFGTLTISDAAYFAGGVRWSNDDVLSGGSGPTPIEHYEVNGTFNGTTDGDNPFPYSLFLGTAFYGSDAYSWDLMNWDWFFDLSIDGDGLLGSIFVNNTATEIGLSGDAALWHLGKVGTDQLPSGLPCSVDSESAACVDARGRWQLISAPIRPVAEPGAVSLFIVGLIALTRRRR